MSLSENLALAEDAFVRAAGESADAQRLRAAVIRRLAWRQERSGATCSACGLEKPLSAFARDARSASGLESRCRVCEAARQRAYRARGPLP